MVDKIKDLENEVGKYTIQIRINKERTNDGFARENEGADETGSAQGDEGYESYESCGSSRGNDSYFADENDTIMSAMSAGDEYDRSSDLLMANSDSDSDNKPASTTLYQFMSHLYRSKEMNTVATNTEHDIEDSGKKKRRKKRKKKKEQKAESAAFQEIPAKVYEERVDVREEVEKEVKKKRKRKGKKKEDNLTEKDADFLAEQTSQTHIEEMQFPNISDTKPKIKVRLAGTSIETGTEYIQGGT